MASLPAAADPGPALAPVVAVAYSGGRDSTALLHATSIAASELGLRVVALHVHHGLHPQADHWARHCRQRCARWSKAGRPVTFAMRRLTPPSLTGESVEAWARRARYQALATMAHDHRTALVLLAHHRRDQAETFLLQALRGAGVAGLAAMPRAFESEGIRWVRPWLDMPREAIERYLAVHRLTYVEDSSNEDPRFARNRLRSRVWPAMLQAFPQAEDTLAQAADWAQDARACLADLARLDIAGRVGKDGLNLRDWRGISLARRHLAIRSWFESVAGHPMPSALLAQLDPFLSTGAGSLRLPVRGGGHLRLYRGQLSWHPTSLATDAQGPSGGGVCEEVTRLSIRGAGDHELPGWGGVLRAVAVSTGGAPLPALLDLELRPRMGGERFQLGRGRPARSLKQQYQAAGVPPWARSGPLAYAAGRLLFVPGLGIDARCQAPPGEAQLGLIWLPARTDTHA